MSIVLRLRNDGLVKHYCILSRNKGSVPYFADRKGEQQMLFAYLRAVNTEHRP